MHVHYKIGMAVVLGVLVAAAFAEDVETLPPGVERLQKAEAQFWEGQEKVEAAFRKGIAEAIAAADKIEIVLLEFDSLKEVVDRFGDEAGDEQRFPIRPYKASAKILQRRTLTPAELKELPPMLIAIVGVEKETGGAFCHLPVHGLRVFEGDAIIFESSFCYLCQNFYVQYPADAKWFGMSSKEFEAMMKRLMPIPEAELERFKAYSEKEPRK